MHADRVGSFDRSPLRRLGRRSVLKGVTLGAGAAVLEPFVRGLEAEAAGQEPPRRVIFLLTGNGLWPHHVQPTNVDRKAGDGLIDRPMAEMQLPRQLAKLEPFRDQLGIIQKLSHRIAGPGDHGKSFGALGCFNWRRDAVGQTVDHAIASAQEAIFPVVGLGVVPSAATALNSRASAIGPKQPLSVICDPNLAFNALFGSAADGAAGRVFNARNKLLDHIRADIGRVRRELPGMDRQKLDIYLDTFEQMRIRTDKLAAVKDRLRAGRPDIDDFRKNLAPDRFAAQSALAAAAVASRLTNVVHFDASGMEGYHWKELNLETDAGTVGHMHPGQKRDDIYMPVRDLEAGQIADMAGRLAAIKEGNGTALDNTLIVWMSDSGEEHHGFCKEWPVVLVGGLGGRLKTAGRFLQFPAYQNPGHRTIRNFYLALLRAVGDGRETFGELDRDLPEKDQAGPLAEILT